MADVPVTEEVTKDISASNGSFVWKDQNYKNKKTDANGQLEDRYLISAYFTDVNTGLLTAVLNQKLTAAGWVLGTSTVTITTGQIIGNDSVPVTISGTPVGVEVK